MTARPPLLVVLLTMLDTVSTVAGYQAVKWIGKQFWSEVERMTPSTPDPDDCGKTVPCK